jgi:transcriptional regulator with XRE-family HTH domain
MAKKWSPEKFRRRREKKYPVASDAARALGVTPANLQRWEKGERIPGVDAAAAMAELVGVRVDDLLA